MGRVSDAKERLLEVAFQLIWNESYGAVSVDHICSQAGVKKGSFYHFFASKSELAVAAYEYHWQCKRPLYDEIFSAQHSPLSRLQNWCDTIYRLQKEKFDQTGRVLGCPYASVGCELSTQDEQIRKKSDEIFERGCVYVENTIADAIREGLIQVADAQEAAQVINSCVLGMMMHAKVKNDPEVLKPLAPTLMKLLGARQPASV